MPFRPRRKKRRRRKRALRAPVSLIEGSVDDLATTWASVTHIPAVACLPAVSQHLDSSSTCDGAVTKVVRRAAPLCASESGPDAGRWDWLIVLVKLGLLWVCVCACARVWHKPCRPVCQPHALWQGWGGRARVRKPRVHIILIPLKMFWFKVVCILCCQGQSKRAIAGSAVSGARGPRGDNGI